MSFMCIWPDSSALLPQNSSLSSLFTEFGILISSAHSSQIVVSVLLHAFALELLTIVTYCMMKERDAKGRLTGRMVVCKTSCCYIPLQAMLKICRLHRMKYPCIAHEIWHFVALTNPACRGYIEPNFTSDIWLYPVLCALYKKHGLLYVWCALWGRLFVMHIYFA